MHTHTRTWKPHDDEAAAATAAARCTICIRTTADCGGREGGRRANPTSGDAAAAVFSWLLRPPNIDIITAGGYTLYGKRLHSAKERN